MRIGRHIAIDTNLLVLLAVGTVSRPHIERHKRLRAYSVEDYDLLAEIVLGAESVVSSPNALTETSNLVVQGISEPLHSEVRNWLQEFIEQSAERFVESARVVRHANFSRLGLTDCAWLELLATGDFVLLTDDHDLYSAALDQGGIACNFNHLRRSLL